MIKIPIDLKYFKLDVGALPPIREGDLSIPAYAITNKETGVQEDEGRDLAMMFDRALNLDATMERAVQYYERKFVGKFEHLDNIDIDEEEEPDPLANMLMPMSMGGGGNAGGGTH